MVTGSVAGNAGEAAAESESDRRARAAPDGQGGPNQTFSETEMEVDEEEPAKRKPEGKPAQPEVEKHGKLSYSEEPKAPPPPIPESSPSEISEYGISKENPESQPSDRGQSGESKGKADGPPPGGKPPPPGAEDPWHPWPEWGQKDWKTGWSSSSHGAAGKGGKGGKGSHSPPPKPRANSQGGGWAQGWGQSGWSQSSWSWDRAREAPARPIPAAAAVRVQQPSPFVPGVWGPLEPEGTGAPKETPGEGVWSEGDGRDPAVKGGGAVGQERPGPESPPRQESGGAKTKGELRQKSPPARIQPAAVGPPPSKAGQDAAEPQPAEPGTGKEAPQGKEAAHWKEAKPEVGVDGKRPPMTSSKTAPECTSKNVPVAFNLWPSWFNRNRSVRTGVG